MGAGQTYSRSRVSNSKPVMPRKIRDVDFAMTFEMPPQAWRASSNRVRPPSHKGPFLRRRRWPVAGPRAAHRLVLAAKMRVRPPTRHSSISRLLSPEDFGPRTRPSSWPIRRHPPRGGRRVCGRRIIQTRSQTVEDPLRQDPASSGHGSALDMLDLDPQDCAGRRFVPEADDERVVGVAGLVGHGNHRSGRRTGERDAVVPGHATGMSSVDAPRLASGPYNNVTDTQYDLVAPLAERGEPERNRLAPPRDACHRGSRGGRGRAHNRPVRGDGGATRGSDAGWELCSGHGERVDQAVPPSARASAMASSIVSSHPVAQAPAKATSPSAARVAARSRS